ncbi:MAG: 2-oxoacid:ferredoxin oxidoreductase subunit beta [Candidatus Wallbacteria bacterium]|nr:2-oxoacid:ferredoxin oxidoreductase subunit beta [Candidatus Wallbacteria bacterium]
MNESTTLTLQPPALTKPVSKADFVSGQDVRWCPGCGDYAILAAVQKALADMQVQRQNTVFISGIGCSSRFPYYMNTYGFHSIHGRAPTLATGLKIARPELSIWVVTGDGDGLSIGGNHLIHTIRRNVDIKILLFNNQIYGLTKGQYSPTSEQGKKTKSTPFGTIDYPISPLCVALGVEGSFVARTTDTDLKHMAMVLERAAHHKGTAFVEIYQNCVIFNDGAFKGITEKSVRPDHALFLEHGKPMTFGKDGSKGIRLDGVHPNIVEATGKSEGLCVHDEKAPEPTLAYMLSRMRNPDYPVPFGVFRAIERPTYDGMLVAQEQQATAKMGAGNLQNLLRGPETWEVK